MAKSIDDMAKALGRMERKLGNVSGYLQFTRKFCMPLNSSFFSKIEQAKGIYYDHQQRTFVRDIVRRWVGLP